MILLVLLGAIPTLAQPKQEPVPQRVYVTARTGGEPPTIDGRLDESVWDTVEWSGDFIQREPTDGESPSHQTSFKVVYDDDALYFAFRMYDDPDKVSRLLSRRDGFPGDWIEVNIDSHHDRRTAYSFTLSLSGTRGDEFISMDGDNWNTNWDPVWNGATQIDRDGWTAEARVPLSQLRFSDEAEQTWGLQVQRRLFRLEERSTWQEIPKAKRGWVSNFGELRGLKNLQPKRRIELLPYAVASSEHAEADPGDPFFDGSSAGYDGGLDGKIGVSNSLTLDFTINPDFGQVEADPSEVNLTAFETFFRENRPFFIEGGDILDLRLSPAITGGSFTGDLLFYSRRIGRPPRYTPNGSYVDMPQSTTILGAFKLSGKTKNGLSIGIMESVTEKERARVDDLGRRADTTVEPLTNYFVGRLQQDFRNGDTQLGAMITAVSRDIQDEPLEFLSSGAYAGGFDFSTYFKDRDYRLEANLLGSRIEGSQQAILEAQTSSARYYQRPDNDSAHLDPTRTSLTGTAGSVRFSRTNNHDLQFQTGTAWRSPGFEINDLGFMRDADQINQFTWVGYSKRNPFWIFDNWNLNGNQWLDWDSAGNFLGATANINTNAQFRNKYFAGAGVSRMGESTSTTRLRGGPSSKWPGGWHYAVWVNSDQRRKLSAGLSGFRQKSDEGDGSQLQVWTNFTFRATNAIQLQVNPSYSHNRPRLQYVATERFGDEERYLFGRLDQETISVTFRLDYTITPDLTVQYYGSPFLSVGRFDEFKRISAPHAAFHRDRYSVFDQEQIAYANGVYEIDENRDGVADYGIGDPDFDARDFNSNLVVRWEYSPGSTLYFVWSQARSDNTLLGLNLQAGDGLDRLFRAPAEDVVLIKISKWFAP